MSLGFEDVPTELVLEVLRNVNPFDLARCAQVSQNLHHISMEPILWTRVSLLPTEVRTLPVILTRSRNLRLDLELWLETHSLRQTEIYNALLLNFSRIRSLSIHGAKSTGFDRAAGGGRIGTLQQLLRTPAPNLERFIFIGHGYSVTEIPASFLDGVAPRLKIVTLDNCFIDLDAVSVLQQLNSKNGEEGRGESMSVELGKGCVLTRKDFERREWMERLGLGGSYGQLTYGFAVDPSFACAMMIDSEGTAFNGQADQ